MSESKPFVPVESPEEQALSKEDRAIQIMKSLGVEKVEFTFSCGGDNMGDTSMDVHYLKDDSYDGAWSQEIEDELKEIIDWIIYDNVEFYDASDGYYMGEAGTVEIYVDPEDETRLRWDKSSQSEWNETYSVNAYITLDPAHYIHNLGGESKKEYNLRALEFYTQYVSDIIELSYDNLARIRYKQDFIMIGDKKEFVEYLDSVVQKFDFYSDTCYDLEDGEHINEDSRGYDQHWSVEFYRSANGDAICEWNELDCVITIPINISYTVTEYREE